VYAQNNPVLYMDINGEGVETDFVNKETGKKLNYQALIIYFNLQTIKLHLQLEFWKNKNKNKNKKNENKNIKIINCIIIYWL
jgi:hypothetical protein